MLHVAHTADLHIGKNRKNTDHLQQQGLMLDALLHKVVMLASGCSEGDSFWFVIAGDIFDRGEDTTREELYLFLDFLFASSSALTEVAATAKIVVKIDIVDGNHDRMPDASCPSVLFPLRNFAPQNVTIASVDPLYIADRGLLLLPFGSYTEADFLRLIHQYKPKFVVGHECLSRITTDTGFTPRDQDKYIEIENVRGVQAIFMGDIHACQKLSEACWYSGSPTTLDHGHKLPKGILYHKFDESGRVGEPVLLPLTESKLKTHLQVGTIDVVSEAVVTELKQHENRYIQITVTPETYAEIDKQVPGFFQSSNVSWEFKQEAVVAADVPEDVPDADLKNYYRPLINQWVAESLIHLTEDEKQECLSRLYEVFDKRG